MGAQPVVKASRRQPGERKPVLSGDQDLSRRPASAAFSAAFNAKFGHGYGMASKGRPYRTVLIEGYEVLIGKGAEENDVLSLQVAAPHDVWLHVAGGTPGSHVVIRNPERCAVPKSVIERAAAHAAWYSKSRGAPRVEVHTCLARDVSKPKGAPPGRVQIRNFSVVKVSPLPVTGPEAE